MDISEDQCLTAFRFFVRLYKPIPLHDKYTFGVYHKCSASCHWVERGLIYICRHTGNIHCCGGRICEELVTTHENIVCSLTGRSFPLAVGHDPNADDMLPVGTTAVKVYRDSLSRKGQQKQPVMSRKRAASEPISPTSSTTRQHIAKSMSGEQFTVKAYNFVTTLLQSITVGNSTLLTLVDVSYVTDYILGLWSLIVKTESYTSRNSHKYKFPYHCAAVIYSMIDGVTIEQLDKSFHIVIPVHDALREHLPRVRQLQQLVPSLKITQGAFTTSTGLFITEFLREIYNPPCSYSLG